MFTTTSKFSHIYRVKSLHKKEKEMLAALRSHCVGGIKHNFPKMYKNSLFCPQNHEREANVKEDTQSQILICKSLSEGVQIPLYEFQVFI